jgi:type 1 glutamine amidotransferase
LFLELFKERVMTGPISRRTALKTLAAGALAASPLLRAARAQAGGGGGKRLLFYTRSQDFPHAAVTRVNGEPLAWGERMLKAWAEKAGYAIDISKDGTLFNPDKIGVYDAFVFYTTGDLTLPPGTRFKGGDDTPPMTAAGKAALLAAIAGGKGFVGMHSATDTFHSKAHDKVVRSEKGDEVDPYIAMIGGEFLAHGSQQNAKIRMVDPAFGGLSGVNDFEKNEEWYSLVNLAPDLHVIGVQETPTMKTNAAGRREWQYQRAPYPETWARQHGKGRVFYTSMGHRQDVWESEIFQKVLMAGIAWAAGTVEAKATPNLKQACPDLEEKSPVAPAPATAPGR